MNKKIFLVDDDSDDIFLFTEAVRDIASLCLHGVAKNGVEALEILLPMRPLPDFIFTDINMPRMNGLECLQEVKRQPRLKEIPVIVISTSTAQAEVAYKLGAYAFIRKPSSMKTLRLKIDRAVTTLSADFTTHAFQQSLEIL
jgi:CheY-like chemotaxis protein